MRILILLVCTALSFMGLIWPIYMIDGSKSLLGLIFAFIVVYAWICYFVMGVSWTADTKVSRWWPVSGTIAGLLSPSFGALAAETVNEAVQVFFAQLFGVSPAALLATWLVIFHMKGLQGK